MTVEKFFLPLLPPQRKRREVEEGLKDRWLNGRKDKGRIDLREGWMEVRKKAGNDGWREEGKRKDTT